MNEIFVFGASGHGKVVIDVAHRSGFGIGLVVDDDSERYGTYILGHKIAGGREVLLLARPKYNGIVAIGANGLRFKITSWLANNGFGFLALIDPAAIVSMNAEVGVGTLVMPGAVINADARVGSHVIVNTAATVDHDCVIDDGVHLAPGVHLCGAVGVGSGAFVGAGSVVAPGVRIGNNAIIGAGSVVIEDIPDGVRAAGSPCRPL